MPYVTDTTGHSPHLPAICLVCQSALEPEAEEGLCVQCLLGQAIRLSDNPQTTNDGDEILSAFSLEGRTLGGYEILGSVAQGGMGVVFRARQRHPPRTVALKVISAGELATPRVVERFRNEARAAARLEHPNIVPIYEVGEEGGWHYFSMQFIEGGTLADAIRKGPIAPGEAVRLLLKIARAAAHAHQHGILHRDLKPTNILLDAQSEPRLTDFGLAKLDELDTGLTLTRATIGTPAYMSPEQAAGRSRDITTATDVYSLGVIFFEMLSRSLPFAADSAPALLRKIMEDDPELPRPDGASSIDRDLQVICLKCLEKDPARRYATAADLADELERCQRHEPILARPAGAAERARKWVRRHPTASVAAGATALALLALAIVGTTFTLRLNRARTEAERNAAAAQERVVASRMSEAARLTARGDGYTAMLSLVAAKRDVATNSPLLDSVNLRLAATLQGSPRLLRLWKLDGSPHDVRFAENDSLLVAATRGGPARVWNLAENRGYSHADTSKVTNSFFAPNASRAVELLRTPPYARVLTVRTGDWAPLQGVEEPLDVAAFSPDGSQLAACGTTLGFWNAETGERRAPPVNLSGPMDWMGYSPDGTKLLTILKTQVAELWDLKTGAGRKLPVPLTAELTEPKFSADGRWLLGPHYRQITLFDTRTLTAAHQDSYQLVLDVNFAPDGKQYSAAAYRRQSAMIEIPSGKNLGAPFQHEGGANRAFYSPDGKWLATAGFDYEVKVRRLAPDSPISTVFRVGARVERIAFSANGRFMAVANYMGLIQVWDMAQRGLDYFPSARQARKQCLVEGSILAFAEGSTARFWDVEKEQDALPPLPLPRETTNCTLSANGAMFGAAFGPKGAMFWELPGGRQTASIAGNDAVEQVFLSPDARCALLVSPEGRLLLVNPATGQTLPFEAPDLGPKVTVGWSGDGKWLALGGRSPREAKPGVWDTRTGRRLGEITDPAWGIFFLAFSPDSSRLLATFEDWNMEPHYARQYDIPSMRPASVRMRHADGVEHGAYSPDGRLIATGGQDNVTRVWRARDGSMATRALRHIGLIHAQDFNPDGRLLATGSADGFARIWDVLTGELIGPPLNTSDTVEQVEFSRDGLRLLITDVRGRPWIYKFGDVPPLTDGEWEDLAVCSTGLEAAADGAGNALEADQIASRFEGLWQKRPDLFAWPESSASWHKTNASLAENMNNWLAAVFHLEQLAKASPEDSQIRRRLQAARAALAPRQFPAEPR